MSGLGRPTLQRFVQLAGERLTGDWVVFGGSLLPLLGAQQRATFDIDVAGPDDAGQGQLNELLRIALDLGLPVEAINQAGAFYLRQIPGWRDELVVFHRGAGATVLVPNATLYLLTKLERLSESDFEDCRAMMRIAAERGELVDVARLADAIATQLSGSPTAPRAKRLSALATAVRVGRVQR